MELPFCLQCLHLLCLLVFGFMQNISQNEQKQFRGLVILCVIATLLSSFGFSKLVSILYPFFGYLGLLQILYIIRL